MARYIEVKSHNTLFVYGSLNTLLPASSVARGIWGAVEQLDFTAFEQFYRNDVMGRPAIEPRRLAAVWILGILRGTTSTPALARQCKTDIELRWLLGDAPVKKSTLCAFRKDHLEALGNLSTQVLALLARAGQLPGKDLVVDGTIIEAAASCACVRERGALKKCVEALKEKIREKLEEHGEDSPEVDALEQRSQRLQQCLLEMDEMGLMEDTDRITVTEPQASMKKLKKGGFAPAHNVQAVCDAQSGAIITMTVVSQGNDQGQLEPQVQRACEELQRAAQAAGVPAAPVEQVAADGAYHDAVQLARLKEQQGIAPVVPDGQESRRPAGVADAYLAPAFTYDEAANKMICPQGKPLRYHGLSGHKTAQRYRANAADCAQCPAKASCCPKSNSGRSVNRSLYETQLKEIAAHVRSKAGQHMLRARSATSEGVFARVKHLMHWRRCRTWGRIGAQAEACWRQITHNILLLTGIWKPMIAEEA